MNFLKKDVICCIDDIYELIEEERKKEKREYIYELTEEEMKELKKLREEERKIKEENEKIREEKIKEIEEERKIKEENEKIREEKIIKEREEKRKIKEENEKIREEKRIKKREEILFSYKKRKIIKEIEKIEEEIKGIRKENRRRKNENVKYVDNLKNILIFNSEMFNSKMFNVSEFLGIPNYQGVYIITFESGKQYVGRSKNIRLRLYTHIKNYGIYTISNFRIFRTKNYDDTCELEKILISNINPELNIQFKKRKSY